MPRPFVRRLVCVCLPVDESSASLRVIAARMDSRVVTNTLYGQQRWQLPIMA